MYFCGLGLLALFIKKVYYLKLKGAWMFIKVYTVVIDAFNEKSSFIESRTYTTSNYIFIHSNIFAFFIVFSIFFSLISLSWLLVRHYFRFHFNLATLNPKLPRDWPTMSSLNVLIFHLSLDSVVSILGFCWRLLV